MLEWPANLVLYNIKHFDSGYIETCYIGEFDNECVDYL